MAEALMVEEGYETSQDFSSLAQGGMAFLEPVTLPRPRTARVIPAVAPHSAPDADLAKRDEMILAHLPLVKYIASRIASRLPSHVEVDDLINAGVIGLIDAIDKFDDTRQIKFRTYAEFRVRGAILDELRSLDYLPRSTRQKASRLEKAFAELEQRHARPATDEEVAEFLGLSHEEYQALLLEARGVTLMSLEDLHTENEDAAERNLLDCLADPATLNPSDVLNMDQVYRLVAEAIDELPDKERLTVSLYYYDELTMKEIGQIMEVTESRVSQIHTKAVLRLRGRLAKMLEI